MRFENPSVPFNEKIDRGIEKGDKFIIKGVSPGNSRFSINFVCGSNFDRDDVAFHFDVRFNFGGSTNVVVRNNKDNKKWQKEEKSHGEDFPFKPHVPFKACICVREGVFTVDVDEKPYIEFRHHEKFCEVNFLNIQGDVKLTKVKIFS